MTTMLPDLTKVDLVDQIIQRLSQDLTLFINAAKTAHEAAIDEENQPDNKYDTTALEASYVAQGQANRAQALRRSIEIYKHLVLIPLGDTILLSSLVMLEDVYGVQKQVFIGPVEGGLKISVESNDVTVITPVSPLGRALIGRTAGDSVQIKSGTTYTSYNILEIK
jgi:hypothetical protein